MHYFQGSREHRPPWGASMLVIRTGIHKMFIRIAYSTVPQATIICMGGSRVGTGGPDPPLKNHKNIGILSKTGPDP